MGKDHKDEFPSIVKRRLLNPSKTDMGVVSKHILQNVIFCMSSSSNQTHVILTFVDHGFT